MTTLSEDIDPICPTCGETFPCRGSSCSNMVEAPKGHSTLPWYAGEFSPTLIFDANRNLVAEIKRQYKEPEKDQANVALLLLAVNSRISPALSNKGD